MDASTGGGTSMVDASLFFKKILTVNEKKQREGVVMSWGYKGGGVSGVAVRRCWCCGTCVKW